MRISFGTNRLVLISRTRVFKIPLSYRGYLANVSEFENAKRKRYVATTLHKHGINIQEKLTDLQIFPLKTKEEDLPHSLRPLFPYKLRNRMQVGKDKHSRYKFFDYEDVKADEDEKKQKAKNSHIV